MRLFSIFILFFFSFTQIIRAEAIAYDIVRDQSDVGFTYQFGAKPIMGTFPIYTADIAIDFERPGNSHVNVTLNTATAKAGFIFATQALRSKRVLDVQTYPDIEFTSNSIRPEGDTIMIDGLVTVRGITMPLTLTAQLSRAAGTLPTERENLRMNITSTLNRHDFGASGFPDDVGDMLSIIIDVQIRRK
jgi:polyisoprenoid-binding protein YceI